MGIESAMVITTSVSTSGIVSIVARWIDLGDNEEIGPELAWLQMGFESTMARRIKVRRRVQCGQN